MVPAASIYRKGDSMKAQFHSVVFVVLVAVLTSALLPISAPAAHVRECRAAASATGHWSWRLIDGRKCWYSGKAVVAKSALRWPAAATAQAKAKAPVQEQVQVKAQAAPVSVVAETRSDPMNAQARMLDDDNTFEARWRARVTIQ
jgi:hypothetical protein